MRVLPVEVPKLDDGLQLVQEPHHTVQGQLWGLQKRVNTKYRVFPAKWTEEGGCCELYLALLRAQAEGLRVT